MMHHATIPSPIGPLRLSATDQGLCRIVLPGERGACVYGGKPQAHPVLSEAQSQLDLYFSGHLRNFTLPLTPQGTPFQLRVWQALGEIPYGETISYAQLATNIGRPKAVRAVGGANGRNPLPIIRPCHRVIGSDGGLTGFSGGLPSKRYLLRLECPARWT